MAINTEFRIIDNYNTFCTLTIGDKKYCGYAECHADDVPIFSQRLGERLAYDRASIDYLRDERDKINEQIKSLKHLLSIYNQSQKTNKESYEYKMLQKQINTYIRDSKELSRAIKEIKEEDIKYVTERAQLLKRTKAANDNS